VTSEEATYESGVSAVAFTVVHVLVAIFAFGLGYLCLVHGSILGAIRYKQQPR
jgi:hypothetical protein